MKRIALVAVLAAAPSLVLAETTAEPAAGDRVRARLRDADGERSSITGRLLSADGRSLTIQPAKGAPVTIALAELRRLDTSRGRRGRGAGRLRGAGIGVLGGAAIGAATGAAGLGESCHSAIERYPGDWGVGCEGRFFSPGEGAVVGAVAFGAAGGVLGAVVGALAPGERWEKTATERVRLSIVPRRGGVGAAVGVGF